MGLQTWAQRHLAPTRVAVIMTLEPVFATAFAVALGGEILTKRLLVGGSLILAATVIGVLTRDRTDLPPEYDERTRLPATSQTTSASAVPHN